jgi:UDP-N-acetylglucosamine diphosphorylase / glucose-1-phosphate thymidylyltransferase / UDP-N-acetylgalactosamine diphosphorylase / glucosamine-1-phosphate N-acetyltransferase / galactosamine-1-phosphate N-acetyltransferase
MASPLDTLFSLEAFEHASLFERCRYPWEPLIALHNYLKRQNLGVIEAELSPSSFLVHPELISIGKGTQIEPGAYIEGPCIIGKNCHIRHGAYLRGNVLAGDGCVIGHATEVKHSILLNRASARHFNYVGDSILGNDVNLGAGFICANYRLDHREVPVFFEGQKIVTSLRKLGAMIGDGSQLGCNGVTSPGAILGKRVFSFPCQNIMGFIPEDSLIRNKG